VLILSRAAACPAVERPDAVPPCRTGDDGANDAPAGSSAAGRPLDLLQVLGTGEVTLGAGIRHTEATGVACWGSCARRSSAGCEQAASLACRPLLLIHPNTDQVLWVNPGRRARGFAGAGEVVVQPGTGHLLASAADQLRRRLPESILAAFDGTPGPF
jgi:hypothetical protein